MSNMVEAGSIVGGPANNDTVNMAQVQTSRKDGPQSSSTSRLRKGGTKHPFIRLSVPLVSGFCSVRHGLALILHLCNLSISTQQMNMSIALPVMVNNTTLPSSSNASIERPPVDSQDNWNKTLNESKAVAAAYDWSPEIQGIILSSLSYGSFLAPIPSSYMAEVFGTRYLSGTCMFITSFLALFTPLAADTGVTVLIVLRVIQGMVQVVLLTSQYSIWARWAPPQERSQLITIAIAGSALGCFIIFLVGGYLCQTIGWPYVFYIFGGIGCVCSFLWFAVIYDDPVSHPFISTREKEYIVCSLAQEGSPPGWSLPTKAMIKSLPLWSILIFYFSDYWHFFVLTSFLPTFITSVLQANIRDQFPVSRVLSAMTVLLKIITCPQYGVVHQPEIDKFGCPSFSTLPNCSSESF
nr:probable small intestine urate exporter isoform X5 [Bubalus bubalis]